MIAENLRLYPKEDGSFIMQCTVLDGIKEVDEANALSGKLEISVKKLAKSRSLDQNALCWKLCALMQDSLGVPAKEIYRKAVRDAGVFQIVCIQAKEVEQFTRQWESHGDGWQVETFDSKLPGCTNLRLYPGTSSYSSEEMSQFLDNLIQDAESIGIHTEVFREEM